MVAPSMVPLSPASGDNLGPQEFDRDLRSEIRSLVVGGYTG